MIIKDKLKDFSLLGVLCPEVLFFAVQDLLNMSPLRLVKISWKVKELLGYRFFDFSRLFWMSSGYCVNCRLLDFLGNVAVKAWSMVAHFYLKLMHSVGL